MTKQLKKGLLTVLLFVMSICCAFSVNSFATVKADDAAPEMSVEFVAELNNFKTDAGIVDDPETDDVDESILTTDNIKAAMSKAAATEHFMNMYKSSVSGLLNSTESAEFEKLMVVYNANDAVDLYAGVMDTARNIATQKGYSYKNHTEVEALETIFAIINTPECAADMAFLKSIPNFDFVEVEGVSTPKYLADARVKIDGWKLVIDNAIAAVKNIDVTTDMMDTVKIWDGSAYLAQYTVVIESAETVEDARTAIETVKTQGDGSFVVAEELLVEAAENALIADQNKILNVQELIRVAYEKFLAGKCYSNKAGIDEAFTAYESLNGGSLNNPDAELNRLYDSVDDDRASQILMMKDLRDIQEHKIKGCPADCAGHRGEAYKGVESFIADIEGFATFAYDVETRGRIDEALENFNALDADVKENAAEYISNYQDLLDAETAWAAYITQIEDMIEAFNGLMDIELNHREQLFPAMDAAFKMPLSDKENQLTANNNQLAIGFNKNVLETPYNPNDKYIDALTTSKELYDHYTGIINSVRAATKNINDDLAILLPETVHFDNEFDSLFKKVDSAIEKLKVDGELDKLYIGAIGVNNYNDFLAMKDTYTNLMGLAETWAKKVNVIGTVCTCEFAKVDEAKDAYKAIADVYPATEVLATDLAIFTVNYTIDEVAKSYVQYKSAYDIAVNKQAEIVDHMDRLVIAIDGAMTYLPADGADDFTIDFFVWVAQTNFENMKEELVPACENAGAIYDYFVANYADAFADYKTLLIAVAAQDIEIAIAAIADEVATTDNISAARAAYEAAKGYTFEIKGIVEGQEQVLYSLELYTADDVKAAVDTLNVLETAENTGKDFVEDVYALLVGAAFDGSNVDADDVDAEATIDSIEDLEGFYKLDVDAAKALKAKYEGWTDVAKAYAYVENEETVKVADAYELLLDLIAIAGTEKTSKIGYIDAEMDEYLKFYYGQTTSSTLGYDELEEIVKALDDSQLNLIESYIKENGFASLGKDRAMAAQLALAIAELHGAKDITEDTIANYYVVRAIYESLSASQKGLVNVASLYDIDKGIDTTEKVLNFIKTEKLDKAEIISIKDLESKLGELEGLIDVLGKNYKDADEKIYEKINSIGKLIETNKKDIANLLEKVNAIYNNDIVKIQSQIKDIFSKIDTIYAEMAEMEEEIYAYIDGKVKELNDTIDALEKLLDGKIGANATAIAAAQAAADKAQEEVDALELVVAAIDFIDETELANAIAAAKAEIEEVTEALDAAIKAEVDARKAADEKLAKDLDAAVAKLNKTITIITVILAVVSVACAGAIVYIFLKKRA